VFGDGFVRVFFTQLRVFMFSGGFILAFASLFFAFTVFFVGVLALGYFFATEAVKSFYYRHVHAGAR
jgi:hypothetical protein